MQADLPIRGTLAVCLPRTWPPFVAALALPRERRDMITSAALMWLAQALFIGRRKYG